MTLRIITFLRRPISDTDPFSAMLTVPLIPRNRSRKSIELIVVSPSRLDRLVLLFLLHILGLEWYVKVGVAIHYLLPDECFSNDVIQRRVMRFAVSP